jgi:hypothetical protein
LGRGKEERRERRLHRGRTTASEKTVTVAVTCVTEARGSALSMSVVLTAATVSPEQIKALLDKAASRLS